MWKMVAVSEIEGKIFSSSSIITDNMKVDIEIPFYRIITVVINI